MRHQMKLRRTAEDRVITLVLAIFLGFVTLVILYPFWYALIISFNEGMDASRGGIFLLPRRFTTENFRQVFRDRDLRGGYLVTIARTLIGTVSSVLVTAAFAYALSHPYLKLRRLYMNLMIFAMYFGGGLIPFFVLLRRIQLMNTFWVYVIPGMISGFNTVIMLSFFREIPSSLQESAKIDGANDFRIFTRIVLPVSRPSWRRSPCSTASGTGTTGSIRPTSSRSAHSRPWPSG